MRRKIVSGSQLWNLSTDITLLPADPFPGLHWKLLSDQLLQPAVGEYSSSYHHHFARRSPCLGTTKSAEEFIVNSAQKTRRIDTGQRTWRLVAGGLANTVQQITTPRSPLKHRQSLVLLAVQSQELSASLKPCGSMFLWLIRSSINRRCLYTQSAPSVSYTTTKETSWSCGWWHWPASPEMCCCNTHATRMLSPSSLVGQVCGKDDLGMCGARYDLGPLSVSCGFWTLTQAVANDKRPFVVSV